MAAHTGGSDPFLTPDEGGAADGLQGSIDLLHYVSLLRRRWPWVVASGIVAMLAVFVSQWGHVTYPLYTAETLVQRLPQATGLAALGIPGGGRTQDEIASELQILRTGQVLGSVVDSTGLRFSIPGEVGIRSQFFESVDVSAEAVARSYVIEPTGDGLRVVSDGRQVASSGPDGILVGPGFLLAVRDPSTIPANGMPFRIADRAQTIRTLEGGLTTAHPGSTNLIQVAYTSRDPVLAAAVTNQVARAYQVQAAERARAEASRRREFLAGRLRSVGDSLNAAQELLLQFQAGASTLNPAREGQTLSTLLIDAEAELRTLVDREKTLEELDQSLAGEGRQGIRQTMILSPDLLPGAVDLLARLRDYEAQRTNLTSLNRRTENAPDVLLLDSLIAETTSEVRLTVEQTLRLATRQRTTAEARVRDLRAQVGDVPERNVAFGRYEQRVEAIQRMYDMLASRFYEAQIAEAVEAGDVQIVAPAEVPDQPSGNTGRPTSPLLGLLAGLVFGFAGVVMVERLDPRIRSLAEARQWAGAEILGMVPLFKSDVGDRPVISLEASASEAFRMLRTNLRFSRAEALTCIAVSSPGPGDGKSVVSANLAVALASDGLKVLLVDADLRRPVQHDVFSQSRLPGLSDLLIGQDFRDVVKTTPEGVWLVTAGNPVPNPAELVGSSAFRDFLSKASHDFDMVIVDTPPVLAVADTSAITPMTEGVIVVVRQQRTHREALGAAVEQVRRSRSSVLGIVVNAADGGGRDGYYYGYGQSEYVSEGSPAGAD